MNGRPRRWSRSPLFWVVIALVVIVVVIRLVLDPIAAHFTHKALDDMEGYEGSFDSVHVSVLPPGYTINRLVIRESDAPKKAEPFVWVEHARASVAWRELLHGRIAARLRVEDPKISVVKRAPSPAKPTPPPPKLREQFEKQRALRVERIEVRGGELNYRDLTVKEHPEVWVHDLELAIENVATRPALSEGRPIVVNASGVVSKSGRFTFFMSVDPWTSGLTFAGRFEMRGLKTEELYAFIEPKTKLHAPEGTIDLFVDFEAKNNLLSGGVKPVLKNVKVRPDDDGFVDRLKAWAADTTLKLFSDRVPDRNAVATVIPIKGRITGPDVQIMPAVMGIIRNAFVEGIRSGFTHLPPPSAPEKQGILTQAKKAVEKKEGPPKAQPAPAASKH